MNVKNNKRRRESQEKIEKAFIELLQSRGISDITVSELIKISGLNRSTFYANYKIYMTLQIKQEKNLKMISVTYLPIMIILMSAPAH